MGFIHAEIDLSNPRNRELASLRVHALVDTGAVTLCIPEHVAVQLDLAELEKRAVTTAEGRHVPVPYVGPVQITFENRSCYTGTLVLGESILLGSTPVEDMNLVVNPRMQTITVNPESPHVSSAVVKRASLTRHFCGRLPAGDRPSVQLQRA